ncbi:hypothetical protein LTR66_016306 [Elasticomyces elasticus]|nr:hypothetical protein LTR66_016306 [Elasticomyces elasticus]
MKSFTDALARLHLIPTTPETTEAGTPVVMSKHEKQSSITSPPPYAADDMGGELVDSLKHNGPSQSEIVKVVITSNEEATVFRINKQLIIAKSPKLADILFDAEQSEDYAGEMHVSGIKPDHFRYVYDWMYIDEGVRKYIGG